MTEADLDFKRLRRIIGLVASVQFFVALEGSMLLPLAPLLAARLHFPVEHAGYLNGAFLASAAVSGLIGSLLLDRYDRRVALSLALAGLAVGTAAAGLADSMLGLVLCRVLAGICGGPTVSLALAVIGDVAPPDWRGRAMGAVSAGSSVALIAGVPVALLLTEWGGWRGTFFSIGAVGFAMSVSAALFLPSGLGRRAPTRGGLCEALRSFGTMLRQRDHLLVLANGALIMSSINMLAMNLAAYFIHNLGVAESGLKYLWSAGGVAGLAVGQVCGWAADRYGIHRVLWAVSMLAAALYLLMFVLPQPGIPVMPLMCVFLVCASGRIVLSNTLSSLATLPAHRGRFMSLVSACNQSSAAVALWAGAQVLQTSPSGALLHIDLLAGYAIAAALLGPIIVGRLALRIQPRFA